MRHGQWQAMVKCCYMYMAESEGEARKEVWLLNVVRGRSVLWAEAKRQTSYGMHRDRHV